jgi:hypothetical protein
MVGILAGHGLSMTWGGGVSNVRRMGWWGGFRDSNAGIETVCSLGRGEKAWKKFQESLRN